MVSMIDTGGVFVKTGFASGLRVDSDFGGDFDFDFDFDFRRRGSGSVDSTGTSSVRLGDGGNSSSSSTTLGEGGFLGTWGRETSLRFLESKTFLDSSLSSISSSSRLLQEASVGLGSLWSGIVLP